jgi:DNA-binding protein YbaB
VEGTEDGGLADAVRLAARTRDGIASLSGRGRSPDGSVRARVGGDGMIEAVRLRPEAMRLSSLALSGQVCEAVRSAQRSFARQASELQRGVLGRMPEAPDPRVLAERLERAEELFARRIEDFGRALDALHRRLGIE